MCRSVSMPTSTYNHSYNYIVPKPSTIQIPPGRQMSRLESPSSPELFILAMSANYETFSSSGRWPFKNFWALTDRQPADRPRARRRALRLNGRADGSEILQTMCPRLRGPAPAPARARQEAGSRNLGHAVWRNSVTS